MKVLDIEEVGAEGALEITLNADEMKIVESWAYSEVKRIIMVCPERCLNE